MQGAWASQASIPKRELARPRGAVASQRGRPSPVADKRAESPRAGARRGGGNKTEICNFRGQCCGETTSEAEQYVDPMY